MLKFLFQDDMQDDDIDDNPDSSSDDDDSTSDVDDSSFGDANNIPDVSVRVDALFQEPTPVLEEYVCFMQDMPI